ncbi:MAG: DUF6152 family protein [Candidatus Rariloculaceae bacterium]
MKRLAATLALALIPVWAFAHHSIRAFYDDQNISEIEGTITNVRWVNPHIRFDIEATVENGDTQTWRVEAGAINFLERDGISRDDLAVGEQIKVTGYGSRFGRPEMVASYITRSSGEDIVLWPGLFGMGTRAALSESASEVAASNEQPVSAEGMFRVWSVGEGSMGRSANEAPLPLRPEALAARQDYDPLTDDTALRCIQQGMPGIIDNPFPMEIVGSRDDVVIRFEEFDVVRRIHMDVDAAPENTPATPHGYSIGRWDGDELVVVTTHIDWPYLDDVGTPMSPALEVIERYSLNEDEDRLNVVITFTDPATFTEPAVREGTYWDWVPGEVIKPFECQI